MTTDDVPCWRTVAAAICLFTGNFALQAQTGPPISLSSVVNAANYAAPLAPGSIASAFGAFPVSGTGSATNIPLPLSLAGLSIQFGNGGSAPLFFVSSAQVNFQVPWELAGLSGTSIVVNLGGQSTAPQTLKLAPSAPGIFSFNTQGTAQGLIVDPTYRLVDSSNPATAGSTIVLIYATGLGAVTNPPATGAPAQSVPLSETPATPIVMIGGASASVQFSGLAPGEVGVYQINVLVPAAAATGPAVPVSLSIGGVNSNSVTMAVGPPAGGNPIPSITSLSPFSNSIGAGSTVVTITGSGFLSSSSVKFNGVNHAASFVSSNQLTIALSAADLASAGTFPVVVSNQAPGGGSSAAVDFLVQAGIGAGGSSSVGWSSYGRDSRHTALSLIPSQPLNGIHWSTPVDLQPQFTGGELLIHYGSPLVTPQNTVIVPVKTGATAGFRVDAHNGGDGSLQWSLSSDYILPPHNWVPEFSPVLTPASRLYFPGAGGTVYFRDSPDSITGAQGQIAFYGLSAYQAEPQSYNTSVMISTPITSDSAGNIYFGFQVTGAAAVPLQSGIARISASGQGTWIAAAAAAGNTAIREVVQNCAPALNESQGLLYIGVSNGENGYLLALNSTTLQPVAKMLLRDPVSGLSAILSDDGTASPTIGPDGDVYYGVLENPSVENHYRGWLLHFDALLAQSKTPASFGWDDTPSVVPSFMVQSYTGASSYLLMTKYNDYATAGGTGLNRIAVLDPNAVQTDPVTGVAVMKEVVTIVGPTPSSTEPGVKEWCINSAAVDPASHSILVNNEDGNLYRWNLDSNTFTQHVTLSSGLGEAYTPTAIGPDGTVYAINNATLFAVGQTIVLGGLSYR